MNVNRGQFRQLGLDCGVPENTVESLIEYLFDRRPPCGFVQAVLENQLCEALGRADKSNRAAIYEITRFVCNKLPARSWGSREIVWDWLEPQTQEAVT